MVSVAKGGHRITAVAGMMLAGLAQAQHPSAPPPETGTPPPAARGDVTTLGEVRALKPDEDVPLDLYGYRSPVQIEPNTFNRAWREAPSLEQVGMSGGYVMMGIYYVIGKTAQGLHTLTRAPDQIQAATARPSPALDEAQQRRALLLCAQDGCGAPPGG